MHYLGIVHHDPGSDWGITFPDLPGCTSAAKRFEDLPAAAAEAVALWLEIDEESGHPRPKASDFAAIQAHPDAAGSVSLLPVPAPDSRTIRLNITLPHLLVAQIDARVGEGKRSAFLAQSAHRALSRRPARRTQTSR